MLVSNTHKFVLFHFPKTAGTSMTEVLAPYLTPNLKIPTAKFMGWQPHHHYDLLQHQAVIKCMERAENEADVPKIPSGYFSASFKEEIGLRRGTFNNYAVFVFYIKN